MVALKGADIDKFVARPDPTRPIVLVFGPDAGLVHERADALVRASVDDPKDPFQLARLDGDELASEPTRLVEEANTIPLFGGRRAVWVRAGGRNFAPAVEALLAATSPDCRVVIEAGDLKRSAPLRALCERAKNAVALPCYADAERDLVRLIDDEMRDADLAISPEARAALVPLLGGDRLASRHEVRKLALFARGKPRVELDDVMAVVADASSLALDGLVDAAFAGRTSELEIQFGKARTAGTAPALSSRQRCARWHSCTGRGLRSRTALPSAKRLQASSRSFISAARPQSRPHSRSGHRRGSNGRCPRSRKRHSRRAANPPWQKRSRSARCWRLP
jgi:DNA polymerase-3 subunit delta